MKSLEDMRGVLLALSDAEDKAAATAAALTDIEEVYGELATVNASVASLEDKNKKLNETNMGLLLRVTGKNPDPTGGDEGKTPEELDREKYAAIYDYFGKEEK